MKPWKVKGWVIPPDQNGEFVANMEKVLDVYKRPYDYQNPVITAYRRNKNSNSYESWTKRIMNTNETGSAIYLWQTNH